MNASTLYTAIRDSKARSLQGIVDDWIRSYKEDRQKALLWLLQFFVRASGSKGILDGELEHSQMIEALCDDEAVDGDSPLERSGSFRSKVVDFLSLLLSDIQRSILYDETLLDGLISFLSRLSDVPLRAFRYTATLVSLKVMSGLVVVAGRLSVHLEKNSRILSSNKELDSPRLQSLWDVHEGVVENAREVQCMLEYLFESVFTNRFRDVLPKIRSLCILELGVWIQTHPSQFLNDSYLKYIGWSISDKVGDVRLKSLVSLLTLYATKELAGKMALFTETFKDRIVGMSSEKEVVVAIEAVRLLKSIHHFNKDALTDEDCKRVSELVFSSHQRLALVAGEFLNAHLHKSRQSSPTLYIRSLVNFLISSGLTDHGPYLVDTLLNSSCRIKDWGAMTDLLLQEEEEPLSNLQESILIKIMVSATRQVSTGEPPLGRKASPVINKSLSTDKTGLTSHFIQHLPPLLRRYAPDAGKIECLLEIPRCFDHELYTTHRQEANLEELLLSLRDIVRDHTRREVMEAASKTLLCLSEGTPLCSSALRSNILDLVISDYKLAMKESQDKSFRLESSLIKVEAFAFHHDLSTLWESMLCTLKDGDPPNVVPSEALVSAINACCYGLLRDRKSLNDLSQGEELLCRLRRYMDILKGMIVKKSGGSSHRKVGWAAFISLSDLLGWFGRPLEAFPALFHRADNDLVFALDEFVQENVFKEEEEDLERRRSLLEIHCKLIKRSHLPLKAAVPVFVHLEAFHEEFGDIIMDTLIHARNMNSTNCVGAMVKALQLKLRDALDSGGKPDTEKLKQLGKRFADSFVEDGVKHREALALLHKKIIVHSSTKDKNALPNVAFLVAAAEFSSKLLQQDKKAVLHYLDQKIPPPSSHEEEFLIYYRNSLQCEQNPPNRKRRRNQRN